MPHNFRHHFSSPLTLTPRGGGASRTLSSLRDAAELIRDLPRSRQLSPVWEKACDDVLEAAQTGRGADIEEARLQIMRALRAEGWL